MSRRISSLVTVVLALVCGCGKQSPSQPGAPGARETAGKALSVAEVTDVGGIDDKSFNASAWAGLQKAKQDLGVNVKYLESRDQTDYETNFSTLADQKVDLIFAVGYLMEDALKKVAPTQPGTKFAIIDGSRPKDAANCVSLKFREEEGSFLAGYLAGKMSKTGAVGFVGGMEGALIKKFESGYYAGARTANPTIRVVAKYVGDFKDVPKGKEIALAEFKDGADILFAAAGKSGLGVLDAANEQGPGFYGIGVDADQDGVHPGRVLTSMMKGVDTAVYDTVKELKTGKWAAGDRVFGVKEGGVHLSPMRYTRKDVPADVLAKLDVITKMISDGKIKVPTTDEELQNFQPPKV